MEDKRIKSTYYLKGDYVDNIDNRSENSLLYKYEILESDLDAYWGILAMGIQNAKKNLTEQELTLIIKILRGRKILGQDIILWAASTLFESIRHAFRSYSKWETVGVNETELLEKIKGLDLIDRIGLCDWAQKQWIKHGSLD